MIACDNNECPVCAARRVACAALCRLMCVLRVRRQIEWFHLSCVGLSPSTRPGEEDKWYVVSNARCCVPGLTLVRRGGAGTARSVAALGDPRRNDVRYLLLLPTVLTFTYRTCSFVRPDPLCFGLPSPLFCNGSPGRLTVLFAQWANLARVCLVCSPRKASSTCLRPARVPFLASFCAYCVPRVSPCGRCLHSLARCVAGPFSCVHAAATLMRAWLLDSQEERRCCSTECGARQEQTPPRLLTRASSAFSLLYHPRLRQPLCTAKNSIWLLNN
jgi:hypothetical protein